MGEEPLTCERGTYHSRCPPARSAGPGLPGNYYQFTRYVHDPTEQPMGWERAASAPSRMRLWRLGGRYLEVHVALGPSAGPDGVTEVEVLLNSLRVDAADAS
jgi:hypothetical protein